MLSDRTQAALIRALAAAYRHTELSTLFLEHGVEQYDTTGNKEDRTTGVVTRLADLGTEDTLLDLTTSALERLPSGDLRTQLLSRLRADGFEYREGRLLPTDAAPVELGREVTTLEAELEELDLDVALTHYRQAVDNFTGRNFEAANGQVRPFLEDLLQSLGARVTGRARNDATEALRDLRGARFLDAKEYRIVQALWDLSHERGPHAGVSDEEEARFRLAVATAAARYLVTKLTT